MVAMAIWRSKTPLPPDAKGVIGTVRLARRESDVPALREGDVAVVDQPELDGRQAQALVDRGVRAVLNASSSSSGRVPNLGPQVLARAGVLLVDVPGTDVWNALKTGETVRIEDGRVFRHEILVLSGLELDADRAAATLADAESRLATSLDSLAANATDHILREHEMLLGGAKVPRVRTAMRGRAAVVVSWAYDAAEDLDGLRRYVADSHPVLIGAGAGADLLLDAGYTPDVVVGAMETLSDRAIAAAGEVVVTTPSGRVDLPERLEKHGQEVVTFVSTGADDDLALILADGNEAAVVVHVGAPPSLSDFLERPPAEVARMFVARLRTGAKIVDAKAVHHFTHDRLPTWPVVLLALAALVAVGVGVGTTPAGQGWFDDLGGLLSDLGSWIEGLFT